MNDYFVQRGQAQVGGRSRRRTTPATCSRRPPSDEADEHPVPDDRPAPGRHPRLPTATRSWRTPASTSWPRTGTRFDRWYTPTAICTPARASLLTGQAPFRHKLLANYERNVGYLEDLRRRTRSPSRSALRENGLQLGLIGKWHVGHRAQRRVDFGFDGPDLPGWHNPVDHPDYLAYLDERGPAAVPDLATGSGAPCPTATRATCSPPGCTSRSRRRSSTTSPPGRSSTLERYAADAATGRRSSWPPTSSARTCPTCCPDEYFDLYRPRPRSSCRRRSRRPSRASRRCSGTTARTGRSTPCRSRSPAS